MKGAVVLSTGSHLPEKVVANQDLVQFPETVNKLFTNIGRYGSTASASVVIAPDEALDAGGIGAGDLTVAFGWRLSWGANLIRL